LCERYQKEISSFEQAPRMFLEKMAGKEKRNLKLLSSQFLSFQAEHKL
jgi:hypothetical protein